ncbi:MAG: ComEA family DNA-binding protein [Ignavibacteriales bacterium]
MDYTNARWGAAVACTLVLVIHHICTAVAPSGVRAAPAMISGGKPLYELAAPSRTPAGFDRGFAYEAVVLRRLACNYLANQGLQDGRFKDAGDPGLQRLLSPLVVAGSGILQAPVVNGDATGVATAGYDGHTLESTFSKQVGSLILDELCGRPRLTPSTTISELDEKTDFWTAFSEGWAAHFQAVAFDESGFPREARKDLEHGLAALRYWIARMAAEGSRPGAASLLFPIWHNRYKWAGAVEGIKSSRFAAAASGNPAGMLAIPGVVSSIIYALVSDPRIQSTYREPSFYAMFAHPSVRTGAGKVGDAPGGTVPVFDGSPAQVFTPLENAYMKVFHVLAESVRPDPILSRPSPVLTLISQYAKAFPGEEEAAYDAFLWATGGAPLEPAAAGRFCAAVPTAAPYELEQRARFMETLRRSLLDGERRLDDGGPQIWLMSDEHTRALCIYDRFGAASMPYTFDLNTATVADLMTVKGITPAMAAEILAARASAGGFSTIRDLAQVRGITPEVLNEIHSMKAGMDRAMKARGPIGDSDISLEPVALSYLTRIAWRILAAFGACLGTLLIVDGLFRLAQNRCFGAWAPPSWLDTRRNPWRRSVSAFFKGIGAMAALGFLFLLLPPVPPLLRLAGGAGTGLVIWVCGALPQVLGISALAGLSARYVRLRAAWSLVRLVAVISAAFLIL